MSFTAAGTKAAVDGVAAAGTAICFFTADPGTGFTTEVTGGTYARQNTVWAAAAAGSRAGSKVTAAIPAGTTVTHWGIATAVGAGAGTLLYSDRLRDGQGTAYSEQFGAAGTLDWTPTLTVTG